MTDVAKTSSASGAGRPRAVAAGGKADVEQEVRRVLAFRLGTTTRAELDSAVISLRGRVGALVGHSPAEAEGMSGADRGFLLEVTHLLDNPPAPEALSHEVYSHVRALARVLRKLAAMNRSGGAGPSGSPRLPLPVRPVPGRGAER
ncbi:hypothetical protein JHN55_19110 [Streptomyces sp. MBT56]|uniref:hypothetical protein n=1 Tax=unclassified Streptomyces TaxID=2593676 RepID=UPI00190B04F9|nr:MULTISPECIES: hypothetical protein [unclassified Streptomyces]MBK3558596.1 hypothetical protein [Streptomyces sp. MBT56]MBK3606086.1 hypothetical protein [Streptomyces sp. MBT54]MBK3618012.1 hypothetical protein [Streptomyces sp. MBT98]